MSHDSDVRTDMRLDLMRDPYALNKIMDFDHVVRVLPDGSVTDGPNVHFELLDDHLTFTPEAGDGWSLMTGYTGQYGYRGPIMHPSEFIGGGMARDILETPGLYVALVATEPCDACEDWDDITECESCDGIGYADDGWAVAYLRD